MYLTGYPALIVNLTATLLGLCYIAFSILGAIVITMKSYGRDPGAWNTAWLCMKYPALVCCFAPPVCGWLIEGRASWFDYLICGLDLIFWWMNRNNGDDDWKNKMKKKVSEIVKQIEGRLVVVVPQAA